MLYLQSPNVQWRTTYCSMMQMVQDVCIYLDRRAISLLFSGYGTYRVILLHLRSPYSQRRTTNCSMMQMVQDAVYISIAGFISLLFSGY